MPNAPAARITDQVQHLETSSFRTGFGLIGGAVGAVVGAALVTPALGVSLALIWGADALTGGLATPVALGLTAVVVVAAGASVVSSATGAASAFSDVGADVAKSRWGRAHFHEIDGPILTGVTTIHIGTDRHVAAYLGSRISCKRHGDQQHVIEGSDAVRLGVGHWPAARVDSKGSCNCWVGTGWTAVIIGGPTVSGGPSFDGDDPTKDFWDKKLSHIAGVAGWIAPLVYLPDVPAVIGSYAVTALLGKVVAPWLLGKVPEGPWRDVAKASLSVFPWYKIKFFGRPGEPTEGSALSRTLSGRGKSIGDRVLKDPVAGNLRKVPPFSELPPYWGGPKPAPSAESPTIPPSDVPGGTSGGGAPPPEPPGGGGGPSGGGAPPSGSGGGTGGGAPSEPGGPGGGPHEPAGGATPPGEDVPSSNAESSGGGKGSGGGSPDEPGGNPPTEDGPTNTAPTAEEETSGPPKDDEPTMPPEDSPESRTKPVGQEEGGAPPVPDEGGASSGGGAGGAANESFTIQPGEVPGGAPEDAEPGVPTSSPASTPATTSTGHPVPPGVDPAHYENLGSDPAVGRFRPNEADTALRVEDQEGVSLERYSPTGPGDKGDWIDPATGTVYDGCSPPPSQYFDQQMNNGNYSQSLQDHVTNPNVDRVVVDTTNLNLTPAQEGQLNGTIGGLPPDQQAKIVRIP